MAYSTTTRAVLRALVQDRMNSTFWPSAEVNWAINEALRVWNVLTLHEKSLGTDTPAATFHSGAAGGTGITAVLGIASADTTLDPTDLFTQDEAEPDWENTAATLPTQWIPVGLADFGFNPPSDGTTLTFTYLDAKTVPTADGDYIQLGEEDIPALLDYIAFILTIKEGGQELQDAVPLMQRFLTAASNYNRRLENFKTYKFGTTPVRPTREPRK